MQETQILELGPIPLIFGFWRVREIRKAGLEQKMTKKLPVRGRRTMRDDKMTIVIDYACELWCCRRGALYGDCIRVLAL